MPLPLLFIWTGVAALIGLHAWNYDKPEDFLGSQKGLWLTANLVVLLPLFLNEYMKPLLLEGIYFHIATACGSLSDFCVSVHHLVLILLRKPRKGFKKMREAFGA